MAEETQTTAFDQEAFKASIMDEVNKTFQGIAKDLKKEISKVAKASAAQNTQPTDSTTETSEPTGDEGTSQKSNTSLPPEVNAALKKLKSLEASLGTLTKERDAERTARLESERKSAIQEALGGISFRDEAAARLFRKAIDSDIIRDDEGNLVAKVDDGTFLPIADHIKSQVELQPGLLAPQGRGGSGATGSKGVAGGGFNLEDIKPGMDRSAREAILKQATALLSS
jgi:hypothetical protein